MSDTRNISQPTQGSEDVGRETNTSRTTGVPSSGTDTQTKMAAASHKNDSKEKSKNVNDDELVINNNDDVPGLEKKDNGTT